MLCPKCGYITFDELPLCPKCKKDWGDVARKVSGIGAVIESPSFLSGVLSDQEEDISVVPSQETSSEVSANDPFVSEESGVTDNEIETRDTPLPVEKDVVADDGGFDLTLDGLSDLEIAPKEVGIPETNIVPAIDVVPIEEEVGGIVLELDDNNEGSAEVLLPPTMELEETGEAEVKPTVDLHDIDLSDLMEPGTTGAENSDNEANDDSDDQPALSPSPLGSEQEVPDLSGIDLSLDNDADGLNLSLEPEVSISGSAKKETETAIPDLGLSLELDE